MHSQLNNLMPLRYAHQLIPIADLLREFRDPHLHDGMAHDCTPQLAACALVPNSLIAIQSLRQWLACREQTAVSIDSGKRDKITEVLQQ